MSTQLRDLLLKMKVNTKAGQDDLMKTYLNLEALRDGLSFEEQDAIIKLQQAIVQILEPHMTGLF